MGVHFRNCTNFSQNQAPPCNYEWCFEISGNSESSSHSNNLSHEQFRNALQMVVCPGDPRDHLEDFIKIGEGSTGIVCIARDKNSRYISIKKYNL